MKPNNKKLFFVKEMPESEEQDIYTLKRINKEDFEKLVKDSKKKEG